MPRISGLFGVLILSMGVLSCGGGGDNSVTPPPPPPPPPACPANTFCLLASTFSPTTLSVPAGTTVTWKNDTGVPHNVLWNDAAGRSAAGAGDGTGDIADASATHTRKFVTAGTYGFHCSIHAPGMTGTLTVNP